MKERTIQFMTELFNLTTHNDRNVKGHALALLKFLQETNPQDDIE